MRPSCRWYIYIYTRCLQDILNFFACKICTSKGRTPSAALHRALSLQLKYPLLAILVIYTHAAIQCSILYLSICLFIYLARISFYSHSHPHLLSKPVHQHVVVFIFWASAQPSTTTDPDGFVTIKIPPSPWFVTIKFPPSPWFSRICYNQNRRICYNQNSSEPMIF